jgi:HTH-type transcriptional regulator / antitoxin HigA
MDSQLYRIDLPVPPHPGEVVVEYLEALGWAQRDLARRADLTPKTISEICNGKAPITPNTAIAFERVLNRPAHLWLNLQRQFDEALARRGDLARLAHWGAWATAFPIKEMKRKHYTLPAGKSDAETLLGFFGVSSPNSWDEVWKAAKASYRQTRRYTITTEAVAAWVRQAELFATELDARPFSESTVRAKLDDLRNLTRRGVDVAVGDAQTLCAEMGISLVLVPELKNTGISGCTKWLATDKVLIGLTLRYKTDDQFWFSFFHELGHVLLHKNKVAFVIDNVAESFSDQIVDPEMQKYEEEANRFAADTLIPPATFSLFVKQGEFTSDTIHDFAESVGVGPGIVVGRLQHDGILAKHQGNTLKQRLEWNLGSEES